MFVLTEFKQFDAVLVGDETTNVTGMLRPCAEPFGNAKVEFCVFDVPSPPKSQA